MIFNIFVGFQEAVFLFKKNNYRKIKLTIPSLYTLHPTLYTKKNRIALAHMQFFSYLCTAFSVREAGESPAQSRCCDSQSDVQILISHWFLANWEG